MTRLIAAIVAAAFALGTLPALAQTKDGTVRDEAKSTERKAEREARKEKRKAKKAANKAAKKAKSEAKKAEAG